MVLYDRLLNIKEADGYAQICVGILLLPITLVGFLALIPPICLLSFSRLGIYYIPYLLTDLPVILLEVVFDFFYNCIKKIFSCLNDFFYITLAGYLGQVLSIVFNCIKKFFKCLNDVAVWK